jgi:DNA-binding PadR family transcriptional regulator
MALDHAIMISLAERPGTGYELGRQFSASLGHFWPASRQQIYRTLARLSADGLITCRDVTQQGRPDKKVYSLAPAGETALATWIAEPTAVTTLRDELGVKLRGAEHGHLADVLADVRNHRDAHASRLALYRGYATTQFPDATRSTHPGPDRPTTAPVPRPARRHPPGGRLRRLVRRGTRDPDPRSRDD